MDLFAWTLRVGKFFYKIWIGYNTLFSGSCRFSQIYRLVNSYYVSILSWTVCMSNVFKGIPTHQVINILGYTIHEGDQGSRFQSSNKTQTLTVNKD